MGTDMGGISNHHNHTTIPTVAGAAAVSKVTHHTPHPGTAVAHITLQLMDAPITTSTPTHPTGTVTPHPTLATSPTDITHTTIPWTGASLAPATLNAQHRKQSQ